MSYNEIMKKINTMKNNSEFSKEEKLAIINQYLLKRYEVTEEKGEIQLTNMISAASEFQDVTHIREKFEIYNENQ